MGSMLVAESLIAVCMGFYTIFRGWGHIWFFGVIFTFWFFPPKYLTPSFPDSKLFILRFYLTF